MHSFWFTLKLNGRSLTFCNISSHLKRVSLSLSKFFVIFTIFSKAPQSTNGWADLTLYVQYNREMEASWFADVEYPTGSDNWYLSVIKSNLSMSGGMFETSSWMLASFSINLERKKRVRYWYTSFSRRKLPFTYAEYCFGLPALLRVIILCNSVIGKLKEYYLTGNIMHAWISPLNYNLISPEWGKQVSQSITLHFILILITTFLTISEVSPEVL